MDDPLDSPRSDSEQQAISLRDYLLLVARMHVPSAIQSRLDLSGIVQQTLLEAHEAGRAVAPQAPAQEAAWYRAILLRNLTDELRKLRSAKRDVARERSINGGADDSFPPMDERLAGRQATPSVSLVMREDLERLTEAVEALPEPQRLVVKLHHLEGLPLKEIAERLGRSREAVAGLLFRALRRLRGDLGAGQESGLP